ncbi:hypothetical protein G7K_1725-t1 [Saitoella complicata NRRL Y-17804]|uniref:SigF-like NTF2-like domain-containing protein n=1 Tax=Saitoella complicata (strain BCRC 22490 / CBS 7301 / JCM 7358 / NBRC 10748 / NRRL Y-17804) TaxID=698492 RepID=A0A0E9NDN8_SAICN|nr:hypothetical protein G7K_1725-t1 [Saitoella complicata NRRL Y-17804]
MLSLERRMSIARIIHSQLHSTDPKLQLDTMNTYCSPSVMFVDPTMRANGITEFAGIVNGAAWVLRTFKSDIQNVYHSQTGREVVVDAIVTMQGHWFFLLGATLRTRTFCRLVFDENDKVVLYHDVWSVQDTIHGMLLGWTRLPGSTESMSLWVHERVVKPVMTMITPKEYSQSFSQFLGIVIARTCYSCMDSGRTDQLLSTFKKQDFFVF